MSPESLFKSPVREGEPGRKAQEAQEAHGKGAPYTGQGRRMPQFTQLCLTPFRSHLNQE